MLRSLNAADYLLKPIPGILSLSFRRITGVAECFADRLNAGPNFLPPAATFRGCSGSLLKVANGNIKILVTHNWRHHSGDDGHHCTSARMRPLAATTVL